jgi:hypothetical protein
MSQKSSDPQAVKSVSQVLMPDKREDGVYIDPKATIAQWLERWLEHVKPNVAPRTHERYAEFVRRNSFR